NTYCLGGGYYATDSSGNPIFNAYHFNVPVIEVAGVQGQVVHQFVKAWSAGPLGEDGNPLPATSEANAAVAESVYQVSGAEEMNLSDVASGATLAVGGPMTYDLKYSNVGSTGISNVFVYDLLGYDSSTGERLAGCEVPRFVSITNAGGEPAPIVQYTTDNPPLPNDSGNWTTTQPADLSTITGVRVQPVSAFSSTAGTFGPLDPQGHVQLTVRDTAGLGAQVCNNASITGQGFAPASANAGSATVIPIAASISLDPLTTCIPSVGGSNQLTITGQASLNNGEAVDEVSLSMNTDTPVDVCNGDCAGAFSRLLPMQIGDNVITVTALSHYAATAPTASETITCTSVGCGPCPPPQPSLSIAFDAPAACTPPTGLDLLVPISGTVTAQNTTLQTLTLYVDAGPAITLCDGNCGSTFSVTAPFVFGTNTALIRAVDSSGQVTVDAELALQCTSEGCGEACAPSTCTPAFQIGTPTASEGLDPSGAVCAEGLIHVPYTLHNCPGSVAQYLFGAVAAMNGNGYVNGPAGVYAFAQAPQIEFFALDAAADVSGEVLLDRTYFSLMDNQVHYLASPGNTVFELIPVVLTPTFSILPGLDLGNAASYLTQSDLADSCYQPGTCVDLVHAPTGQVMFEDLYPSNGDHDYNDQTISYSYDFGLVSGAVTRIRATFNVLSVGAAIDNDLFLHIPGLHPSQIQSVSTYYSDGTSSSPQQQDFAAGGDEEVVFTVFANTRNDAFSGQSGFLNTDPSRPTSFGRAVMVDIVLNEPITSVDTGAAPYDIFLGRSSDYGHQIHLPQFDGQDTGANQSLFGTGNDGSNQSRHYVNTNGLPFALAVPDAIAWPKEKVAIDALYPDIVGFATSAGAAHADWYLTNVQSDQAFTQGSDGNGAPSPLSVDSAPPLAICGH
ncbi:MAG: LruC domain-containing protein, partial [Deltaproteobacteria bacterium]|nr:LruC domain-containing protein [Deltaproteobacteria bacterium]